MDKQEAYKDKMDAQMDKWNAEIELLRAKLKSAKASGAIELSSTIDDLRGKKQAAAVKLEKLKDSSGESWDKARNDAEAAFDALKKNIDDITEKLGE